MAYQWFMCEGLIIVKTKPFRQNLYRKFHLHLLIVNMQFEDLGYCNCHVIHKSQNKMTASIINATCPAGTPMVHEKVMQKVTLEVFMLAA